MEDFGQLRDLIRHPYPLVFATLSGAHLYGFPSPDSDYDLRGIHVLPLEQVVGLDPGEETVQVSEMRQGKEVDLVTHDAAKYFRMVLKKNGYVLEQIFSPLVIQTTPEHRELKDIAQGCITRHHSHHYLGFSGKEWELLQKESPPRVKPLLYVFRVLMTGIHLMVSGRVEADIRRLNRNFKLEYLDELLDLKKKGHENIHLSERKMDFYQKEYQKLRHALRDAAEKSHLPDAPRGRDRLNDLLVRIRMKYN